MTSNDTSEWIDQFDDSPDPSNRTQFPPQVQAATNFVNGSLPKENGQPWMGQPLVNGFQPSIMPDVGQPGPSNYAAQFYTGPFLPAHHSNDDLTQSRTQSVGKIPSQVDLTVQNHPDYPEIDDLGREVQYNTYPYNQVPVPYNQLYNVVNNGPSSFPPFEQNVNRTTGMGINNGEETSNQQVTRHYNTGSVGSSLKRGMACSFCRRRKLRCSGEKPICGNCVKYRKACEYGGAKSNGEGDAGTETPKHPRNSSDPTATLPPEFSTPNTFPPQPDIQPRFQSSDYYGFTGISASISPQQLESDQQTNFPFTQYGQLSFPPYPITHQTPLPSSALPTSSTLTTMTTLTTPTAGPIPPSILFNPTGVENNIYKQPKNIYDNISPSNTTNLTPTTQYFPPVRPSQENLPRYPSNSTDILKSPLSSHRSMRSTPDPTQPAPPKSVLDPSSPQYETAPPSASALYTGSITHRVNVDPIDGLTERLGEFLFTPAEATNKDVKESGKGKRRKSEKGRVENRGTDGLVQFRKETDGLTDQARENLLGIFLANSRLFFEMSVPRFRYRMTFQDRRRPSLALLNAMYVWAARMSGAPAAMEDNFFIAGCRSLEAQTSRADRLVDGIRAAMLLSVYAYTCGRYHEGYLLCGVATRIVVSSGLHQIPSCVFSPPPPRNPFLRNKTFLSPPPEDRLELAERIHTFWAVYSTERCAAVATGFPCALKDEDITTPWPRALSDIASGLVTAKDDTTVRDLYRFSMSENDEDSHYLKWVKTVTVLERATKLAFIDPTEDSEYARAWESYSFAPHSPNSAPPPAWLDQPKYRCPSHYRSVKLGLDQLISSMGIDGIFPVDRKRNAQIDGSAEPFINSHTVILHHLLAAIEMLLNDINSDKSENTEALKGARKSIALMTIMPQLPVSDVDSFVVTVWGFIAKILIKEVHRVRQLEDRGALQLAEGEADIAISEIKRIGETMNIARSTAVALEDLKSTTVFPESMP